MFVLLDSPYDIAVVVVVVFDFQYKPYKHTAIRAMQGSYIVKEDGAFSSHYDLKGKALVLGIDGRDESMKRGVRRRVTCQDV